MTIKVSGSLGANEIQNEFGDTGDFVINEYYGAAPGLPTSGQISWSDFYGRTSPVQATFYNNQPLFRIEARHDRYVDIAFDVQYMYGVIWDANPSFMYIERAYNNANGSSFINTNSPNGLEPLGSAVTYSLPTVNMNGTTSRSPLSVSQSPNASNQWIAIFKCNDGPAPGATRSQIQGNLTATPLPSTNWPGPRPRFDKTFGGPYLESDRIGHIHYLRNPTGASFVSLTADFPDPTTGGLPRALTITGSSFSTSPGGTAAIGVAFRATAGEYSLGKFSWDLRTRTTSNVFADRLRVTGTIRYRNTNYSYTNYLYIHYLEVYLPYVPPVEGG